MNTAARIDDDDIHAFGPRLDAANARSPHGSGVSGQPSRRWWVLALIGLLALTVLAAGIASALLLEGLRHAQGGWEVLIDGQRVLPADLDGGDGLLLLGAVLAVLLTGLVVLPLTVGMALLAAALGVGVALIAIVALAAAALAPLWLPAWLLWLLLRRGPKAGTA